MLPLITETVFGSYIQQVYVQIDSRVRICGECGKIKFGDKDFMMECDNLCQIEKDMELDVVKDERLRKNRRSKFTLCLSEL